MTRTITPERLLEENEALRQIIREALPYVFRCVTDNREWAAETGDPLLELMRAAIGEEKANDR